MPRLASRPGATPSAPRLWHTIPADRVAELQETPLPAGLEPGEVTRRLARHGPNRIREPQRRGPLRILLGQFSDFMVLVLAGAAVLAGVIGEPQDAVAIAAILLLNALLGFVQEFRAERALSALQSLAAPTARVRRAGALATVPASEVVPGDLVLLEAGNRVPADLRLVETAQLRIEEAALTGESLPADKLTAALDSEALPIGDRVNLAYRGTTVVSGRGVGIVVATGMATELGRVAELLAEARGVKTPLQLRLGTLGRHLAIAALVICTLILGLGVLRGEEPLRMILTAVSLAVAAIPEALPAVVTVALSLGARRMVRRHVLVRQLPAVETLGSVTLICTDKTGTLTENRMRVEASRLDGGTAGTEAWSLFHEALALNNDVQLDPGGALVGDPMETALYRAAHDAGCDPREAARRYPRVGELPFEVARGRMTTLHRGEFGFVALTKGAPERLLEDCVDRLTPSGIRPLDRDAVLDEAERMAADGLRVLAIAFRRFPTLPVVEPGALERGQTLLGLVGLRDPLRPGAKQAVATCRAAGISVVMITGDHRSTAHRIARDAGILDPGSRILTGAELARLDPETLAQQVAGVRVFARVAPEQKLAIVQALQHAGECVAMTGDGINDAPALRRADIGIAMGKSGTDVAREAAHLVLLDDNFESIVAAVRAGRRIYDNIRKFVRYVVSCNAAEIWTLLLAPVLALPVPLLPIHLLWINLVTDGLPGLALAAEPEEPGLMQRPPRPPSESFFARGLWQHVLWSSLLLAAVTLGTQAVAFRNGSAHWQTMTFTVLAFLQMGQLLAIRSERVSFFHPALRSNPYLLGAVALTVLLQLATIYVGPLARVFKTQRLTLEELLLCAGLSTIGFIGTELGKWLHRHFGRAAASPAPTPAPAGR